MVSSIFMDRSQIKSAIIKTAQDEGISFTEMAKKADVSPSTLTGFVNDAKGRSDHVLSNVTINKLSLKFPTLRDNLKIAAPITEHTEVKIIGNVDLSDQFGNGISDHMVKALRPDDIASVIVAAKPSSPQVAIGMIRNSKMSHLHHNRLYFVTQKVIEDKEQFHLYLTKLCLVNGDDGNNYFGILLRRLHDKDKYSSYYIVNSTDKPVKEFAYINWISPCIWIKP